MEDDRDMVQKILSQAIENIVFKYPSEIIQNSNTTNVESTEVEIERTSSGTSGISFGSVDVELRTSTSENETDKSCDDVFNETIDEAISKFEFEEKFKEASIQTCPVGIDRESQCDLIIKINRQPNKKVKIENSSDYNDFNEGAEDTARKENIRSERTEVCERILSFSKHTPKIRVGLSKRARLQPLHTKLIT